MSDFTFLEVHFHEFNPTNTAPLVGRGGASHGVGRGGETPDPDLDDVPIEEAEVGGDTEGGADAETADDGSGGPGLGLVVLSLVLAVAATVAARKFFGGDDEFDELAEIDDVA